MRKVLLLALRRKCAHKSRRASTSMRSSLKERWNVQGRYTIRRDDDLVARQLGPVTHPPVRHGNVILDEIKFL